jgi:hypothetical protein
LIRKIPQGGLRYGIREREYGWVHRLELQGRRWAKTGSRLTAMEAREQNRVSKTT